MAIAIQIVRCRCRRVDSSLPSRPRHGESGEHRRKRAATQHRLSEHVGQGLQNRDHLQARTARTLLAHNTPLRRRVEASTAAYLSPRPRIALRSWSTACRTSGPNTMEPR